MPRRTLSVVVTGILAVAVLASCAAPSGGPTPSPSGRPTPSSTPTADPLAGMSLAQQVGQLFMVGSTATAAQPITLDLIREQHLGNVFLSGRSTLGVAATAAVVSQFRAEATAEAIAGVALYVATDQEGGYVQVLRGPGFDSMPTGVQQGALGTSALESDSARWGAQLKSAGVNLNLAPVVDLVGGPVSARSNPPIGAFQRELGYSASAVIAHADAFRAGMSAAGVQTVLKHFPGLGFVSANTDTTAGVTDDAVTASGADIGIYRHEIASGARYVMVSSAIYQRIDPSGPAVFSRAIVTGLLRNTLGFDGLILTDDLSGATQVQYLAPADRAIDALEAGVDIVLVTKDPSVAPQMMAAVSARAGSDAAFARLVTAAARRVVESKRETISSTK